MITKESIFTSTLLILLLVNFGIPYLIKDLDNTITSSYDTSNLQSKNDGLSILSSVSGVLIWSFGLYPVWLDFLMLCVRILMYISLYRMINPVGA